MDENGTVLKNAHLTKEISEQTVIKSMPFPFNLSNTTQIDRKVINLAVMISTLTKRCAG